MERDSFIFYKSFYEAIKDLPKDIRLEVLTAIVEYGLYGREPESLKPFARGMFTLVRPNLDANIARYLNGKKGGRKKAAKTDYSLTFLQEIEAMRTDKELRASICSDFNISESEYDQRLTRFLKHCREDSKKKNRAGHDSDKDAKDHLRYWMTKAFPENSNSAGQNKNTKAKSQDQKIDYSNRLEYLEIQQAKREEEWRQRQENRASPEDLIRRMGYDPAHVSLSQALNPEWREKNPPTNNKPQTN